MRLVHLFVTGTTAMVLVACASGSANPFARTLPDETRVIDGPNLALPPQFELRPPRDAKANAAEVEAQASRAQAQSLIVGVSSTTSAEGVAADDWLVGKAAAAGGTVAQPNVRQELEAATQAEEQKNETKKPAWKRWFSGRAE
jgi:hypothetical protein